MTQPIFKFPSTPHLAVLGKNTVRDDKVLSLKKRESLVEKTIIVAEKRGGASLGI